MTEISDLVARVEKLETQLTRVAHALLQVVDHPLATSTLGNAPPPTPSPPTPNAAPNAAWFPVIHTDPACLKPAYYLTRRFDPQEMADIAAMRVLVPPETSYRAPRPDDVPRCSACSAPIHPFGSRGLDFSRAITPVVRPAHLDPPTPNPGLPPDLPNPSTPHSPLGPMDPRAFSDISKMIERIREATASASTSPAPAPTASPEYTPPHTQAPPEGGISTRITTQATDDGPGA